MPLRPLRLWLREARPPLQFPYGPRREYAQPGPPWRGFTLVELLVVIAIVGTLLTIAVPRYFASVERSKEAVLKENLAVMRDAIQKYYGDKGKYPDRLEELAAAKYLRRIPVDPMTSSHETWVAVPPKETEKGGVYDVHSGAPGKGLDGTAYTEW